MSLSWIKAAPVLVALGFGSFAQAQVVCNYRDKGRYTWGQSPDGCDAASIGDAARVKNVYGNFTYDIRKSDRAHITSYMNNMDALLRDLATDYLKRREPGASQATIKSFVKAIESVATQESYWTHYRWGHDGRLKVMTGDQTHSMGMMQLHDKVHSGKNRLKRFDLTSNILLGVEQFYNDWRRARNASCVRSSSDKLEAQARAAYSAYNGGPAQLCRWADTSSKWAQNDRGYDQKYDRRPWASLVTNTSMKSPVDIECLKAGRSVCAGRSAGAPEKAKPTTPVVTSTSDIKGKVLVLEDGRQCFSTDSKTLYCATDLRVFSCLEAYSPSFAKAEIVKMKSDVLKSRQLEVKAYASRDDLCRTSIKDMILPGQSLKVTANADLLDKADGKATAHTKAGDILQVLDYEVSGQVATLKYRVVSADGTPRWILAGTEKSRTVEKSATAAAVRLLPIDGDKIITQMKGHTNLRASAGLDGKIVGRIAQNTNLKVLSVVAIGGAGERWLQVEAGGQKGFIYSGHTSPEPDTVTWVKIVK